MAIQLGSTDVSLRLGGAEVDAYLGSELVTFSPTSIAGLQLWLDAADLSTISTGTGVSEWRDKSPTGSKWAQTTANNQPATGTQSMNGKNVLVFDGTNDSLSAVAPLSTSLPMTMIIVQRIVSGTNFGMTYTAGTGNNFNVRQLGTTGQMQVIATSGNIVAVGNTSSVGVNEILTMIFASAAGTAIRYLRNGSAATVTFGNGSTDKPTLTGTHYIGQRSDGLYANIWVAEILAYSADLTDAQRQSVERYLGKKWGITVP